MDAAYEAKNDKWTGQKTRNGKWMRQNTHSPFIFGGY